MRLSRATCVLVGVICRLIGPNLRTLKIVRRMQHLGLSSPSFPLMLRSDRTTKPEWFVMSIVVSNKLAKLPIGGMLHVFG